MPQDLTIGEAGIADLAGHAAIPIRFLVDRILEPDPLGGPLDLVERPVSEPWLKDYDTVAGADPAWWPERFDTTRWRILSAWVGASRAGGVVVFADAPGVELLEGRPDLALIWDLRVAPAFRGRGVGRQLISAAAAWARSRRCSELMVETQSINVGACRFYAAQGFALRSVRAGQYPGLPDELQLLWYLAV